MGTRACESVVTLRGSVFLSHGTVAPQCDAWRIVITICCVLHVYVLYVIVSGSILCRVEDVWDIRWSSGVVGKRQCGRRSGRFRVV